MTSLTKFKQRFRGEQSIREEIKSDIQPLEVIAEHIISDPIVIEDEQVSIVEELESTFDDTENNTEDLFEDAFEDVIEDKVEVSKLKSMTKVEIDGYASEHGIQLDRRQTKFNMITEFIQKIEEKN